jgi:hypothetical protein
MRSACAGDLVEVGAEDAYAFYSRRVVAAPFCGWDFAGAYAFEAESGEETADAIFAGACEYIFEVAGFGFFEDFADQDGGYAFALEASEGVHRGYFAGAIAAIGLGE